VQPLIKPAMFLQRAVGKKPHRRADAITGSLALNPTAFSSDAKRGQAKAGGRNARHGPMIFICWSTICARPIEHQARAGAGLLPEILKRSALKIFEKGLVSVRKRSLRITRRRVRIESRGDLNNEGES